MQNPKGVDQSLKDIENAQAALRELDLLIPEKAKLAIYVRTRQVMADYLRHGETGKLCLLHLALTVNLKVVKDEL